jgi:hypothetical protein
MINPPKLAGAQVLFRQIVVSVYDPNKEEIIGAYQYEIDGSMKPVSFKDVPYDVKLSTTFTEVITPKIHHISGTQRTYWLFPTLEQAYIQKILLLDFLRSTYINETEMKLKFFNYKVPVEISQQAEELKNKHPEYFL